MLTILSCCCGDGCGTRINQGDIVNIAITDALHGDLRMLQEGLEKRTAAKRVMDRQTIFVLHVSVESGTEYCAYVNIFQYRIQRPLAKQLVLSRVSRNNLPTRETTGCFAKLAKQPTLY